MGLKLILAFNGKTYYFVKLNLRNFCVIAYLGTMCSMLSHRSKGKLSRGVVYHIAWRCLPNTLTEGNSV